MRGAAILFAVALGCLANTRPAAASEALELALARDQRSLLTIPAGESVTLFGLQYTAQETATVYATLSSEFVGVAVISGRVSAADTIATAGEVLVTPIERQRTMRYIFDGAALARSLDDAQVAQIGTQLAALIAVQRRQQFWGRLEPVGINLRAPGSALIETIRSQYLGEPAIVAIRAEAQGDAERRRLLTATRFAAAIRAGVLSNQLHLLEIRSGWGRARSCRALANQPVHSAISTHHPR